MSTPTFVAAEPFVAGQQVTLGEDAAHHIRVRRLDVGTRVALVDGQGARATGVLVRCARRNAAVEVETVNAEPPPRGVHLLLPVADKERMLLIAEKAAELGAASWRPVQYRRSRSVAARGEGPMFTRKVTARMVAALEQSGGAWLPSIYPDATVERAVAAAPDGVRLVLDAAGAPLARLVRDTLESTDVAGERTPITVAVGPEGGIEPDELVRFTDGGFSPAAIGRTILRFETAAIAALGVIQSFDAAT